jgi:hypothetical protein
MQLLKNKRGVFARQSPSKLRVQFEKDLSHGSNGYCAISWLQDLQAAGLKTGTLQGLLLTLPFSP